MIAPTTTSTANVILSFCLLLSSVCPAATPGRPNIVFILTDDQRYDELGFLNSEIKTPSLDALAREGVHFQNAVVTTALCSPSRASILTGKYAHSHGIVDNLARDLRPETRFFPQALNENGYQTAFIGKWHMGRHSDNPQPGFDHWVSFAGQGHYLPDANTPININGKHVPQKGYITDELTDYAIDWLEGIDPKKNFFLYLSHKALHDNFTPAERHKDLYNSTEISLPKSAANTDENYKGKPLWVKNQRNSWHGIDFPYHSNLDVRDYKKNYHRALASVDESIARVRAELIKRGLDKNTIIFFMGDNGFMFGEHGLIDKRNAYEESMRVPLIVHGPGIIAENYTSNDMVANIDIAPTILDLANVTSSSKMHGLSFKPQLMGRSPSDWRKEILYEYFWEWVFPQTPTTYAIRTPEYKLIQYHGIWDTDELYNMREDPQEMHNLIERADKKDIVRSLRKKLYRLIEDTDGETTVPFTMKKGAGLRFRSNKGSFTADHPDSLFRYGKEKDIEFYED